MTASSNRRCWTALAVACTFTVAFAPSAGGAGKAVVKQAPVLVVIAVIENGGLNVLHEDYRGEAHGLQRAPSLPPSAVEVVLPTAGSFTERLDRLRTGTLGHLKAGVLYRIKGSRLVGIYTSEDGKDLAVNRDHATGTTSAAVGMSHGTAPGALLVYVADTSAATWKWLEQQSWIDVISASYTELSLTFPGAQEVCASMQRISDQGRMIFTAAGNGEPDAVVLPPSGLPQNYQVGGVDQSGRSQSPQADGSLGSTRPYETGDRYTFRVAAPGSLRGSVSFVGTSGSAPRTAGRAADLIAYARKVLRSQAGFSGGSLAVRGPGASLPRRGPLSDGRLSRGELADLMHHVAEPAEPAGPSRYFVEGYGALTASALDRAKRVMSGSEPEPLRPEEDAAHSRVETGRAALYPSQRCG